MVMTTAQTHWNKNIPIKINVFSWRLIRDRLPTRFNLNLCSIDVHSTRCPVCDEAIKTSQHFFVDCTIASSLWSMVTTWWGFTDIPKILEDLIQWGDQEPNKYTEGLGTFEDQGEGRKPNKYTEGMGTFEDQGEGRKPNKYTEGMDQGEDRKPNKYTEGMGTFKDQAKGLADHFRTSAAVPLVGGVAPESTVGGGATNYSGGAIDGIPWDEFQLEVFCLLLQDLFPTEIGFLLLASEIDGYKFCNRNCCFLPSLGRLTFGDSCFSIDRHLHSFFPGCNLALDTTVGVLSLAGRSDADPSCNDSSCLWELFAKSLVDMAKEGLVKESEIKSFNVPTYTPYKDEVMDLIHKKGSFSLYLLESYEVNWDPYDTDYASVKVSDEPIHGKRVANILRAAAEPIVGAAVVVVWCGVVVVVVFLLRWWSGVNMENYQDPPVTLTIRNIDDSLENCVLIHFMSCRQIESLPEHTDAVPFTYHLNGHFIEFGREEFCLITGLRFGPENSDHYVEGINPFKRLLFGSDIDGVHITGQMLLDKINDEEFSKLQDEDAVAVCQLAVLHLILLGRQPAHNIPEWWFRLRNSSRWDRFYACQALPNRPPAKYTLSGFTWAFKTWILETYKVPALEYYTHQQRYPRAVAWSNLKRFKRENLKKFFDGVRPNRKLRADDFEAKAEWWVCSRNFFDGRIHEAPPIPPPVNLTSRFDVPKYIDQRLYEQQQIIVELQKKNEAQDILLNEVYNFYKGQSKPVEVREHYGLTDLRPFQNSQGFQQAVPKMFTTQASDSFYDVGQTTPIYSTTFEQPMPSRYPTSYPGTPHIATPMAQQGFAPWSSTSYQAGPSHVGGVNPDAMHHGKRETFPSKYQLSPFTCMPDTTVAPKKRANNIRNTTRNAIVSPLNLEKAGIDLNSQVEELVYLGSRATDDYISLHNVDHTKVVRYKYTDCMTFLESPESVYLDCFIKGFVVEVQFWRELLPYLCKGAISTGSNLDHIGWLSADQINCWMELMIRARPAGARYTVAKTGTSSMLDTSGKFLIETDFHLMGMLDGSSRPYPSWDEVDIVSLYAHQYWR
ncbi:phospholipase-like protein [Tanacetum coccineum]|uniref:Phospholipase-like protein n=1 Tax=Tanacetum coccineum TaxID=301880 RepID=A0ABQ4ZBL9_9ASTR